MVKFLFGRPLFRSSYGNKSIPDLYGLHNCTNLSNDSIELSPQTAILQQLLKDLQNKSNNEKKPSDQNCEKLETSSTARRVSVKIYLLNDRVTVAFLQTMFHSNDGNLPNYIFA
ncbi:hypothetical protein HELRODRAFT_163553 [Helobdella robusta]|uniref:Uncharacterized protein n=1 Tax=Helobdella robusta TaxID=6412 RepID=T1EU73_HELRO|nr:hypothetical protein HELRODRAFT_163553 [Helobdella robusta]ESN96486.1 hypothetical protein HELRODRAFT_163553 [Helobdella robusta]